MFHPHPEHIFRWQSLLRHSRWHAIWLVLLLAASGARALPEDAAQQIDVDANSSEIDLDLGLVIYRGSNETPVRVSQGSMLITGTEIHMELRDGVLVRATAIGNPAHFQQQPEADKAIVYVSGQTLMFDNSAQLLTADVDAEFIQAGYTVKSNHIDYDIEAGRANAGGTDGERVQMTLPPRTPAN